MSEEKRKHVRTGRKPSGPPSTKGLTRDRSTVIAVRVSKEQQERFDKLARQAHISGPDALRAVLEMALSDPVNTVKGLIAVTRDPEHTKILGYSIDRDELERAGQQRLPDLP